MIRLLLFLAVPLLLWAAKPDPVWYQGEKLLSFYKALETRLAGPVGEEELLRREYDRHLVERTLALLAQGPDEPRLFPVPEGPPTVEQVRKALLETARIRGKAARLAEREENYRLEVQRALRALQKEKEEEALTLRLEHGYAALRHERTREALERFRKASATAMKRLASLVERTPFPEEPAPRWERAVALAAEAIRVRNEPAAEGEEEQKKPLAEMAVNAADDVAALALRGLALGERETFFNALEMLNNLSFLLGKEAKTYRNVREILRELGREKMGGAEFFLAETVESAGESVEKAARALTAPLPLGPDASATVAELFRAALLLLIGSVAAFGLRGLIRRFPLPGGHTPRRGRELVAQSLFFLILFIALLIALDQLGLDLTALAVVAGALSVGVGFGLRNLVNNLAAGAVLSMEKRVKAGDWIQVRGVSGRVRIAGSRSLVLVGDDNADVVVPNAVLFQYTFTNWSARPGEAKLFRVPYAVAAGSDLATARKAGEEAAASFGGARALVTRLGAAAYELELVFQRKVPMEKEELSQLLEVLKTRLDAAGLATRSAGSGPVKSQGAGASEEEL